jgi:filamentous hemagglutinin family protein
MMGTHGLETFALRRHVYVIFFLLGLLLPCTEASRVLAQVSPAITPTIGTGNLGTIVTPNGNVYTITGGTRPQNGPNLFHSFGTFNVPANNMANFHNDTALPTTNILGRVTGGNVSLIFGTIQTSGFGNANLFLMNPAGFLFGPTATLNVGGMVTFTSADYLRFSDNARFNAAPNMTANEVLSMAPVAAFGFLGSNPGAITIQGSKLTVATGQGISLIGGNITIENGKLENGTTQTAVLSAPNGQINLASVASPGELLIGTLERGPNINGQSFGALGTTQILQKSVINTTGAGGGAVLIRSGRFVIDDSSISTNTTGLATGKGIDIQTTQDLAIQNGSSLEAFVFEDSTGGNGGDVRLRGNSVLIQDSELLTGTEGAGNAGKIVVQTDNNLEIVNSTLFTSSFFAPGHAGNIELTSTHGDISITTEFPLVTSQTGQGSGNTGNIIVTAREGDVLLADGGQLFTASRSTGAGGRIEITAKNLTLIDASMSDDNLSSPKPGGITITLSDTLRLQDGSVIAPVSRSRVGAPAADFTISAENVAVTEGSRLSSETFRAGQGGHLNIFTDNLQLTDGGQIRSGSTIQPVPPAPAIEIPSGAGGTITIQGFAGPASSMVIDGAGSGIFTTAEGTGAGGNTNISAQTVTIQNGGAISASTSGIASSATGGNITISSVQSTILNNGGSITASSTGPGNAGNITIDAGQQFTSTNSSVTTQATQASGGNITVIATDMVRLTNSQLNASVEGSETTVGGNITIDPQAVILQNSQIVAQATQGQGGNIAITTQSLLTDGGISLIDASSQFGISGTVNIQSPTGQMAGRLVALPKNPLIATSLFSQRCAALTGGQFSSFVVAGRYGVPPEPGGWLASSFTLDGPSSDVATEDETPWLARDVVGSLSAPDSFSIRQWPLSRATALHAMHDWTAGCGS